jgi:hypothetical protein
MDTDTSFLGDNFTATIRDTPERPPIAAKAGVDGAGVVDKKKRVYKRRGASPEEPGADLPLAADLDAPLPPNVTPEARQRAKNILDSIGKAFSENRKVSQSQAYEVYQRDVADNAQYLITGGIMTMKELSELLMKLEEFRKRSSESGKTPATLLAEWLRGETVATA